MVFQHSVPGQASVAIASLARRPPVGGSFLCVTPTPTPRSNPIPQMARAINILDSHVLHGGYNSWINVFVTSAHPFTTS
jgi:hypothetical protein